MDFLRSGEEARKIWSGNDCKSVVHVRGLKWSGGDSATTKNPEPQDPSISWEETICSLTNMKTCDNSYCSTSTVDRVRLRRQRILTTSKENRC
ncbi:hypothetical protein Y032_0484g2311 [Ancylostoma ceylanicum]|uniref:Uncharacterized protein n=1 Tax=Ancylostoma ceylanicum TaxID=53326 RepID=A0A016WWN9_9BILA|nr:hypothetical protein Y032_0484g2311 [Ancylostoma ceylanicum]